MVAIARLQDGVPSASASAWFDVWLRRRYAAAAAEHRPIAVELQSRATPIPLTNQTLTAFSAFLAAFALVLLIACANVANMMLARGVGRQREIAVRLSLGARRTRIVRQLLVESVMLAGPAALVALALVWTTAFVVPEIILRTWPEGLPPVQAMIAPMEPDLRVAIFLVSAAFAAAVLFGLAPALQTSRTSLTRAARGEFGESVKVSRLRSVLVVAQVAASALFLVTAFGVLGALRGLTRVDPVLDLDLVADVRVAPEHRAALVERLGADSRIETVGAARRAPLYGALRRIAVTPDGADAAQAGHTVVTPEYFDLFRLRVLRGRVFTREEAVARADLVLISEATAAKFWPGQDALGQFIELADENRTGQGTRPLAHRRVQVIGIVQNAINGALMDGIDETCIYFPTDANTERESLMLLVRARSSMREARGAIADATAAIRPDALFPVYAMTDIVAVQIWALGWLSGVVTLLAAIALALAVSGTYGVIAYLVMQRTREFGIRVALGATAPRIVRSVVQSALGLGIIGTTIGAILAVGLFIVVTAVLEIAPAFEIIPFVAGTSLVLAAMAFAAAVPSLRAARVDPAVALRTE
jgi:predicted permease